ncbi:MAG: 50S ribosomal protein L35 [Syntrophaceticus sp.]
MPKMKTHRGAAKRFKRTASGKWKRSKAFRGHLLAKKSSKRKRRLRKAEVLSPSDQKRVKRLLPYL